MEAADRAQTLAAAAALCAALALFAGSLVYTLRSVEQWNEGVAAAEDDAAEAWTELLQLEMRSIELESMVSSSARREGKAP